MSPKTRKVYVCQTLWVALLVTVSVVIGCSQPADSPTGAEPPVPTEGTQSSPARKDLIANQDAGRALIGVWMGQAMLNEQALMEKLESLPANQQAQVQRTAVDFLTTVMAIDLRADGSVEKEIELTPAGGQPLRGGGYGQWRVVRTQGDQVLVETQLQLADGETVIDQQWFQVYRDGSSLTVSVPLGDELAGCNPSIVLYRQQFSDTNIAEQPEADMTR